MRTLASLVLALVVLCGAAPAVFANPNLQLAQALDSPVLLQDGPMDFEELVEPASAEVISDSTAIVPGKPFRVGVRIKMEDHWHIYYKEPGSSGYPTDIKLDLPDGFTAGELEWEKPSRFEDFGDITYGYDGETVISITVTPPADLKPGESVSITANVRWLACKDSCVPGEAKLELTLPVSASAQPVNSDAFTGVGFEGDISQIGIEQDGNSSVFDGDLKLSNDGGNAHGILMILLFAFIGGLILNFMPCVLPVVSFKIVKFVEEAGESRSKVFRLGIAYSMGTVSTCLALASIVIALQVAGVSVGWGFQFQQPLFLLAMAALVTVMSMGLFGVFFIQAQSGKQLTSLSERSGYTGAFFTGVVATILSTPCTAPFLGTAIGFAFAQPWWTILLVFAAIGAGLAAPYLLLSMNPGWQKLLPKPGAWMEHFKVAMGFVMLGSAVWLLSVLGKQVGPQGLIGAIAFIVAVSFSAWLVGTFGSFNAARGRKLFIWLLAGLISASSFWYFTWPTVVARPAISAATITDTGEQSIAWQTFSKQAVDQELAAGRVVFLDFTAEWCQTCKFNEATVLSTDAVRQKFEDLDVAALKADWTLSDPKITEVLRKFGRSGVPLYVIMSPHRPDEPIVLPELITKQMVIDGLEAASKP